MASGVFRTINGKPVLISGSRRKKDEIHKVDSPTGSHRFLTHDEFIKMSKLDDMAFGMGEKERKQEKAKMDLLKAFEKNGGKFP